VAAVKPAPSRERILIRNGTVVTANDTLRADVLVEGETVAAIGVGLDAGNARVIEAAGRYVMPGGIDAHTHMELPFGGTFASDDFATGTAAAAWGGTTTIIDFAVQSFGQSLRQGLEAWHQKAAGKAHIDYGFHMIVREVNDGILREMDDLVQNEGVPSFKLFMAYPGVFMLDDAAIFQAMSRTSENGGLIMMHAENGGAIDVLVRRYLAEKKTAPVNHGLTRPSSMEGEATGRAIALARLAGVAVYIVHLSSKEALDAVRAARDDGAPAFAETCPQYLYLSLDDLGRPGFEGAKYVCSPPLRPRPHQDDLWKGLLQDDLQLVATDHCPFHFRKQKVLGKGDFSKIPNGLPGVEDRFTLIYDGGVKQGRISLNRFVELIATAPARMFGLYPRKGTIAPGSDADIVIFNPGVERVLSAKTHHMNVDYSCYEGRRVSGLPEVVMQRGQVLVEEGRFMGRKGQGQFLKRARFH
jgi:dihydropyrimidinase